MGGMSTVLPSSGGVSSSVRGDKADGEGVEVESPESPTVGGFGDVDWLGSEDEDEFFDECIEANAGSSPFSSLTGETPQRASGVVSGDGPESGVPSGASAGAPAGSSRGGGPLRKLQRGLRNQFLSIRRRLKFAESLSDEAGGVYEEDLTLTFDLQDLIRQTNRTIASFPSSLRQRIKQRKQKLISRGREVLGRFRRPRGAKLLHKISFVILFFDIVLSSFWCGCSPWSYYVFNSAKMLVYIFLRILSWRAKRWHYFLFDFCYWANFVLAVHLHLFPQSAFLWHSVFSFSGVLGLSAWLFRNSLVPHSIEMVTNTQVHVAPLFVVWTLRWFPPPSLTATASAPLEAAPSASGSSQTGPFPQAVSLSDSIAALLWFFSASASAASPVGVGGDGHGLAGSGSAPLAAHAEMQMRGLVEEGVLNRGRPLLMALQDFWFKGGFLSALAVYLFWAALYYPKIFLFSKKKIERRKYATLFKYCADDLGIRKRLPRSVQPYSEFVFFVGHFALFMCGCLFVPLMDSSFVFHTIFTVVFFGVTVFNGANFYIEYFAKNYEKQIAALDQAILDQQQQNHDQEQDADQEEDVLEGKGAGTGDDKERHSLTRSTGTPRSGAGGTTRRTRTSLEKTANGRGKETGSKSPCSKKEHNDMIASQENKPTSELSPSHPAKDAKADKPEVSAHSSPGTGTAPSSSSSSSPSSLRAAGGESSRAQPRGADNRSETIDPQKIDVESLSLETAGAVSGDEEALGTVSESGLQKREKNTGTCA
mmetsp:Transcript_14033/g.28083  ORF Transcript_14033/g.28083 Transcript_14033/m.28083 type:complete len:763 (-) Transcript_14033:138-2426(-)